VIYLDGEGGYFDGCGYPDYRFDAWQSPRSIQFNNIYTTFNEQYFFIRFGCGEVDFGGQAKPSCCNLDVGTVYAHGFNAPPVPGAPFYLRDGLAFDGTNYVLPDESECPTSASGLDPWAEPFLGNNLFNGGFTDWEGDGGSLSGWTSHGGGGSAFIVDSDGNTSLELKLYRDRTHSWFWLRPNFTSLKLRYHVSISDSTICDDSLKVTIRSTSGEEFVWTVASLCVSDAPGVWHWQSTSIPLSLLGDTCTLRIWQDVGPMNESSVLVDDLQFEVCEGPAAPESVPASVCAGRGFVMLVASGGGGADATLQWYSNECGGTPVGTGNNARSAQLNDLFCSVGELVRSVRLRVRNGRGSAGLR